MPKKKNASQVQGKPLKYEPVPVNPNPCTEDELEIHLRAFIKGFISEGAQGRWLEFLVQKRPVWFPLETRRKNWNAYRKMDALLNMFGYDVQTNYVHRIHGSNNFPLSLARDHGTALGVYFDPQTPPCKMTVAEAATKATEGFTDAIFSFMPGKKAISFHHEGGAWLCER